MIRLSKIKSSTFFRTAAYIGPYAPRYVTGLVGSSIMGFLQSLITALGLKVLTNAALSGNMREIARASAVLLLVLITFTVINAVFIYFVYAYYRAIGGDVRKDVFQHVEVLPMRYVENSHSGDLLSRINNDMWRALRMLGDPLSELLSALISGTLSGVTIFILNWKLGLIALGIGIVSMTVNTLFMEPVRNASKVVRENISKIYQIMSDTVMGGQVIKIFNLQRSFVKSLREANDTMFRNDMKVIRIQSLLGGFNSFGGFLSYMGILVIGSVMILNRQTDFGTLIAIIQLVGTFFSLFRRLGTFMVWVNSCLAASERLFETLDEPDEDRLHREKAEKRTPEEAAPARADDGAPVPVIGLRDICFRYKERTSVLEHISLDVYKDQVVAVVGSSGSGKSTLFKLLLGFYESDSGDIRYFGKSSLDYALPDIRRLIAYVPQDSYLFSGTIRENIGWGKEGAADGEIIEAAKSAYAHDFIMKLPNGYDTEVGERGARLSGGERQRVAIARALLKNAPILLLDEATSSLDSESEQQVQKALEVLMKGRTTMVIAHRLSTIQHADRIIVLQNGSICEEGTHASLLEKGGIYAYLYNLQFAVPS